MFNNEPRAMGTEIEFGIACPADPTISPILTSTAAVMAYADHIGLGARRTRWDYKPESPLKDARGFDLRRYTQSKAPVMDPNAMGAANIILRNGARFYVDHAHPEYSSPEVTDALSAVIWDKAGETIMHKAASVATEAGFGENTSHHGLKIYKNNVDGKGASYGAHENYLYRRSTTIESIQQGLIPFFVTRQIFTGAGRVGLGQKGEGAGYQISQRADYIETTISLETTLNRGIINTRDEPHAPADQWRRLHVIIGDANVSEYATFLKLGTTSLVLDAIEAGVDFSDLALEDPVGDVARVSRDLTCTQKLRLDDRHTTLTAVEIQRAYRDRILSAASDRLITITPIEERVLSLWDEILSDLALDPLSTSDRLDWSAKLSLLNRYRNRAYPDSEITDPQSWSDAKLQLIDLQYSDCDPQKSLYQALVKRGSMKTLVDAEDIDAAVDTPPAETRAWLRGRLISRFPQDIMAASWDSLIVSTTPPVRIDLGSLTELNAENTFDITEGSQSVEDVIRGLGRLSNNPVVPL